MSKQLKKEKALIKHKLKNALKRYDYEVIEICFEYIKDYDKKHETNKYNEYLKYFKVDNDTLEVLRRREIIQEQIKQMEAINVNVYDTFSKVILDKLQKHIDSYIDKKLFLAEKKMFKIKKQMGTKQSLNRIRPPPTKKTHM